MRNLFLVLTLLLSVLASSAQKPYEDNLELFIAGNLDALVSDMDAEKDWDYAKSILKLNAKNSALYLSSLIALGDLPRIEAFMKLALKKHPHDTHIQKLRKELSFYYRSPLEGFLGLTEEEKAYLNLEKLAPLYLQAREKVAFVLMESLRQEILSEIAKLSKPLAYFPTALDYLILLEDPSLNSRIKSKAEEVISKSQHKLFPNTMDNYELASAYKALATLALRSNQQEAFKAYTQLAEMEISKMRSFWIEEDLRIYRPILKITSRRSSIRSVLPQWILMLRMH